MSPRWTSTSPARSARAEELDPARAVDEVEERRACPCRGARARGRRAGAPRGPRCRARAARPRRARRRSRRGRGSASAVIARKPRRSASARASPRRGGAAPRASRPSRHDLEAVGVVEGDVRLAVRQERAGNAVARGGLDPGLHQRAADPLAPARAGRRRSRRGTSAAPGRPRPASPRPRARRRGSATVASRSPQRRRDERPEHRRRRGSAAARAASQRAQPAIGPGGRPDLGLGHLEVHPEEPGQERRPPPARPARTQRPGRVVLEGARASIALASSSCPISPANDLPSRATLTRRAHVRDSPGEDCELEATRP